VAAAKAGESNMAASENGGEAANLAWREEETIWQSRKRLYP
jgi:hypothetical protein